MTPVALAQPPLADELPENEYGRFLTSPPSQFEVLKDAVYLNSQEANLEDGERIVGVVFPDGAYAFPLRLISYHHVVNETIENQRYAVTFCVMADSAVVYTIPPESSLIVGGLLSGVLVLKDESSGKLYPQICNAPVTENIQDDSLEVSHESFMTTWGDWKRLYPQSKVLAPIEKYELRYEAYDRKPTKGFAANPVMNPTITRRDERLPPGELVFGIAKGDESYCWTVASIREKGEVVAKVDGREVRISWNQELKTPDLESEFDGYALSAYWYAWSGFYPDTILVSESEEDKDED